MIIPVDKIPTHLLNNLIREFVLQDLDCDSNHAPIEQKCEQVMVQLINKTAVVTYSELHENFNIFPIDKFNNG